MRTMTTACFVSLYCMVFALASGAANAEESKRARGAYEKLFDQPAQSTVKLVLEKALEPGKTLDVASLRGKVVLMRAVAPE